MRELWYIVCDAWGLLKMVVSRKSYWAIALNKQFVEIRVAKRKPRAIRTEHESEAVISGREAYQNDDGEWRLRYTKRPQKISLKNVIHVGGEVVKAVDVYTFWRAVDQQIPVGECLQLSGPQVLKLLGKRGRGNE